MAKIKKVSILHQKKKKKVSIIFFSKHVLHKPLDNYISIFINSYDETNKNFLTRI